MAGGRGRAVCHLARPALGTGKWARWTYGGRQVELASGASALGTYRDFHKSTWPTWMAGRLGRASCHLARLALGVG
eukprot:2282938-Alexandrium_andersonii.AAC.1